MIDIIKRLTSEPTLLIIILTSFILFKTTFEKEVGTEIIAIYIPMAILSLAIFLFKQQGVITTQIKPVTGNSAQSLLSSGIAIIGFTALYSLVNNLFRQSVLPIQATSEQLSQTAFQSFFGALVKFASVDFSQLTPIKYYLFGVLIPLTETLALVGLFIFFIWVFNITLDLKNPRLHGLIITLATLFMWFHLKVRGVNNNLDLAMTFLFAYLTFILVTRLKEYESANEFHVGTNVLALVYGR